VLCTMTHEEALFTCLLGSVVTALRGDGVRHQRTDNHIGMLVMVMHHTAVKALRLQHSRQRQGKRQELDLFA
jgi:hypothetical protein